MSGPSCTHSESSAIWINCEHDQAAAQHLPSTTADPPETGMSYFSVWGGKSAASLYLGAIRAKPFVFVLPESRGCIGHHLVSYSLHEW